MKVEIPAGQHAQYQFFHRTRALWKRLGDIESWFVSEACSASKPRSPIYITSLARSGTTILTELLNAHKDVTCHRYADLPNCWTPYWRNHLADRSRRAAQEPIERAHQDRLLVTRESPEAVEEIIWRYFFAPDAVIERACLLEADTEHAAFESFYRAHLAKLLCVRSASRYLAKANYHLGRIAYLHKLFPDARFVIPVRDPVSHIASLDKQHRLFCAAAERDARIPLHLSLSGHDEFGPGRLAINFGDAQALQSIQSAWAAGREVEGWARYWHSAYNYLLRLLNADSSLAESVLLVSYEQLCAEGPFQIDRILAHCGLEPDGLGTRRQWFESSLSLPDYYRPEFTDDQLKLIEAHCRPLHQQLAAAAAAV